MAGRLQPDAWVSGVTELTPEWLKERDIHTLLVDLDNTIGGWRGWELPQTSVEWLNSVRDAGITLCILSNSRVPKRVGHIAETHDLPFVAWAGKPRRGGFDRAMEALSLDATDGIAMVGDQLFTDILGAKRAGVYAILVTPLSKNEFVGTKSIRGLERFILSRYGLTPPAPANTEEEPEA